MTWRIAAVAFVLCFALTSGSLIADDKATPPTPTPTPKAGDIHDPDKTGPITRPNLEKEKEETKLKNYSDFMESHFPLDRSPATAPEQNDVDFFRDMILAGKEKAGRALGELVGSIYKKEKETILAGEKCTANGEAKDAEAEKDKPFYQYVCAAAYWDINKKFPNDKDKEFQTAFLDARTKKEAANQAFAAAKEKIAAVEKELGDKDKPVTEEKRKQLLKDRDDAINGLISTGQFKKDDFNKFATSQYSKKALLEKSPAADSISAKQSEAAITAARMGATVDPKTLALTNTYNIGGKDTNVVVGQLGAAPAEDQQVTKWALKALAQTENADGLALVPGKNNVRPVAYKEGAALRPKQQGKPEDSKFTLADTGGLEPKPVAVKPADAPPAGDQPATAAPKLGELMAAKDGDKVVTNCKGCHDGTSARAMDFKDGAVTVGGKPVGPDAKIFREEMPFFAELVASDTAVPDQFKSLPKDRLDALRAWAKEKKKAAEAKK